MPRKSPNSPNTFDNFKLVFTPEFLTTVVRRMDANEDIFKKILDDEEFRQTVSDWYARLVYERARASGQPDLPMSG